MSAATASPLSMDVSGTQQIPFSRLVLVEFRKSYDTRASFWLLAAIGIVVLLVDGLVLIATVAQDEPIDFGGFVGAAAFFMGFLLPVLGIMLVTAEWSQRTAMVSFSLEPRRERVILAKAVVGVLLTLAATAAAIVLGAVCNLLYGLMQGGADWTFGWPYFFGFVIAQSLAMLTGFALAALLLNTPAAIVVFFIYKYVLWIVFGILGEYVGWFADLRPWIDFQDAQVMVMDWSIDTGEEWGQLLVSGALMLGVPIALGMWRILRAEVK